jgi:peptidoglycan/xylan/chitin deacetylase (PgdA/CDA1 family)
VVISLDFELRWGIHDVYGLDFDAYRGSIERSRDAVPALLKLLVDYRMPTTWATVGAVGCVSWDEYFARAPAPPRYTTRRLAIDPRYADLDPRGDLHFAPELLRAITDSPGQELGSHTFSHLYLREKGVTENDVAADLAATAKLFGERYDIVPRSLVFPRNQCAFIDVIRSSTIRVWRGNQGPWYYDREDSERNGALPRVLRLMDELNPLCTRAAPLEGDMTRASLFLRLSLPEALWQIHLQRVKRELKALRPAHVFHVWFHPEILGEHTKTRLARVRQILELIAECRERGRIRSCAMHDLVSAPSAERSLCVSSAGAMTAVE